MYYAATWFNESVQGSDTDRRWPSYGFPGGYPFDDDDDDDPSDEPWSVASRRHRSGVVKGRTERAAASDSRASRKAPQLELVLYTSSASENCQRALRAIRAVLREYDSSQVSFTVHDLMGDPAAGDEDAVIFTPTLVKRGPGARTYMVGDLDRPQMLADLLDVNGVRKVRA